MKLKSNQTRTYDGDGYKKRAACLCFRSESEEEVRRRPGVAGVGGRRETRRGGAAVRGRCAGAAGRASRLGLNEVPAESPSAKMREKEKGRWAEGSGSESGRSAPAGPRGAPACSRDTSEPAACHSAVEPRGEGSGWGRVCGFRSWPPALDPGRAAPHLSAQHMCGEAAVHEAQAAPLWQRHSPLCGQLWGLPRASVCL